MVAEDEWCCTSRNVRRQTGMPVFDQVVSSTGATFQMRYNDKIISIALSDIQTDVNLVFKHLSEAFFIIFEIIASQISKKS